MTLQLQYYEIMFQFHSFNVERERCWFCWYRQKGTRLKKFTNPYDSVINQTYEGNNESVFVNF